MCFIILFNFHFLRFSPEKVVLRHSAWSWWRKFWSQNSWKPIRYKLTHFKWLVIRNYPQSSLYWIFRINVDSKLSNTIVWRSSFNIFVIFTVKLISDDGRRRGTNDQSNRGRLPQQSPLHFGRSHATRGN